MYKLIYITLVGMIILTGVFSGCEEKPESAQSCEVKPLNPNGDSELALLMREMTLNAEAMSSALKNGTRFPEKPKGFEKIITAVRTDSTIEQAPFEAYAQSWLYAFDTLYSAPETQRVELFNALVGKCESCHKAYCHGPLKRISRMYVSK